MLEDIVKQIKVMLQNQLPAKLDQIELERADGVALEDIQSLIIQVGGSNSPKRDRHLDGRQKYPSIIVSGEVTIATEATIATSTFSRRKELRHKIYVWVAHREVSPDSELAQAKILRYVEAIERILSSDPTLGGKAVNLVVITHAYLPKGGEEFTRKAVLIMEAKERPSTADY